MFTMDKEHNLIKDINTPMCLLCMLDKEHNLGHVFSTNNYALDKL